MTARWILLGLVTIAFGQNACAQAPKGVEFFEAKIRPVLATSKLARRAHVPKSGSRKTHHASAPKDTASLAGSVGAVHVTGSSASKHDR